MTGAKGQGGWDPTHPPEMIELADGRDVPKACVDALDNFELRWPGASFRGARAGLAAAVLEAIGFEL